MSTAIYKDTPVGFHRVNKAPLDDSDVFYNIRDVLDYIDSGAAYDGQRICLRLPHYNQNVTLKTGKSNKLFAIPDLPSGHEWITKQIASNLYVLIYYYNSGSEFTNQNQQIRFSDSFAWSALPYASLISGDDANITYLLELDGDETASYTFTQPDFTSNEIVLSQNNKISHIGDEDYFYHTDFSGIGIMPRSYSTQIVRLWVKGNDFYKALGV